MKNILIQQVALEDIKQLQAISKQTFCEAFSSENTEENMKQYLASAFSIEQLSKELAEKKSEFYFAKLGHQIIGYLKINTGQSQTEMEENALEIERIYVLKDFYGKKVGQLLYEKAIALAQQIKVDYVWLGVWEENPRAIRFYEKNGFKAFDKHVFKLGDDEQIDLMMKLYL